MAASVEDVPADLRALARRVPPERLQYLSAQELADRCAEAAALFGEADTAGPGHKPDRLRRQAKRVLEAMSPAAYNLAMHILAEEKHQAELDGNDARVADLREQARSLDQNHPQPDPAREVARLTAEVARLTIPPAPPGSALTRRFGRSRRQSR
jgi:hypothetical protein